MPGSGKSTVGVLLAKLLGYRFVDVDLLIQEREGALLQEILDARGTRSFLDAEEAAVRSLDCRRTVIAPGGSCVLRDPSMEHLKDLGRVLYLRLSFPELSHRITNLSSRGIAFAPGQDLKSVYDQRAPLYERYAHLTVEVDGQSLEQTLAAVRAALASP